MLIQLGLGLCDLTGATIAVVDANVRYPGLGALNRGRTAERPRGLGVLDPLAARLARPAPRRRGGAQPARWSPSWRACCSTAPDLLAHVLVDLTGFELLGSTPSAAACMDGVAIVARAHLTHEQQLMDLVPPMPQGRFLGVLLVG